MNNLKKILIVLPSFLNGGTNTCLRSLLPVLKEHGFDVDVFAITNVGPNKEYAAKYAKILGVSGEETSTSSLSFMQRLANCVKSVKKLLCKLGVDISPIVFKKVAIQLEKNNYDLIVSYQEGITTHFCSYFKTTPKIAWVHCDYDKYAKVVKGKSEEKRYSGFKKVVCVSEFTKNQFLKHIHSCPEVIALHNITDVDVIVERSKLPIVDKRFDFVGFRIVSVGRINEVKRFSEIPRIVRTLKEKGVKDFRWYIVGDGDLEEKQLLEENIRKCNASEIILLGNQDNPYPFIANADLYVSTSSTEACPCVINEAKILHTPIVSTNFGSVYEFIEDGVNGLISPIESIADKIAMMITDQELYHQIKSNISTFRYDNDLLKSKLLTSILEIES